MIGFNIYVYVMVCDLLEVIFWYEWVECDFVVIFIVWMWQMGWVFGIFDVCGLFFFVVNFSVVYLIFLLLVCEENGKCILLKFKQWFEDNGIIYM